MKKLFLILPLLLLLAGCGGGGGGGTSTTAPSISVDWPMRTRGYSAPSSALSVRFVFQNPSLTRTYATVNANRTSTLGAHTETYASTTKIPVGGYTVSASFYSLANQGGGVVASVTTPVKVGPNGTLLNPNGTALGQIAFDNQAVSSVTIAANQSLTAGATQQLLVTAYDANRNPLALTPGSFKFAVTSGSQYLSVSPDGVAAAIAAGQASVQAVADGVSSPATSVTVLGLPAAPSFPVDWPVRTRNFSSPNSGLSVRFLVQNAAGTQTFATVDGNRSSALNSHTETYTSPTSVPIGSYTVNGTFYSQANQTGVVVATVTVPVSVSTNGALTKQDGSSLGQVGFSGVVKSVAITANQTVPIGGTQQLQVTALDANANPIALSPGSFTFSLTGGARYLAVTADGIATGLASGTGLVTASVDGVTSATTQVAVASGFTHVFRFTQQTDTIALTGGTYNGACPLGSAFTVEAFVRPTSTSGLIWEQWSNTSMNELLQFQSGAFDVLSTGSGQPENHYLGTTVPQNQWSHLAWVYDGTNVRLYQNGVLSLTRAADHDFDPLDVGQSCTIGTNGGVPISNSDSPFSGDLAELRISNVVRYTGSSFTPPSGPLPSDSATMLLVNPSAFSSTPTTFSALGSQGITATLGTGIPSATSPTWVAYTP